jgi:hypothetical protein
MHNKPLVPTRTGEALVLAAYARRWATHMRICSFALALWCTLPSLAAADPASEFEVALAKWRAADLKSHSFVYEWSGGVVIAPYYAEKLEITDD